MESKRDLAHYVFRWHYHLLMPVEKLAYGHLGATMKVTQGYSDLAAQESAKRSVHFTEHLSTDPKVLALTSEGYEAFVERTAARILRDCADKLKLNRCPNCNALARTPTAKQCRFCGHDWH